AALRRICRTRLDLPPPPRSSCTDGQGIFDLMAVLDGGGGGGARSSGGGGGGSGGGGGGRTGVVGTTECSLVDLVFLPEVSVLLGLVGGRPEVQAFCSETGLVLAVLCGHALPVSCMLWIPSQLMLATGSADTTVRVWDIGVEIVQHADEWTRFKRECLLPSDSRDRLEKQAQRVHSSRQNQGYPSVSSDISALENALVRGQDEGGSSKSNNSGTENTMSAALVSKDNARRALRSLRPEVLRQAGARAVWRTGWVTAVLDHHAGRAGSLNRQTATGGATTAGGSAKNARTDPLIEVTYDDGTMELGVDSRRLRRPEEALRHKAKGNRINGGTDSATPSAGPDWERRPVRPVVDARVAVYGFCEARLCELVIGMIMGGESRVVGGGAVGSPAPPTRLHILTTLQAIRARAACAAAVAGDKYINNDDGHSSARGCADGHQDDDRLASPAALEAALEAMDVSDEDLQELADALAVEAHTASASSCLLQQRDENATANKRRRRLAPWAAIARALIHPRCWPPPSSMVNMDTRSREGNVLTSFDNGGGDRLLRQWNGLRLPVPCKHLLSSGRSERGGTHGGDGNRSPVTCLTYLPLSMLLVSGHSDGRVRLWDPCDRRHKLAPPPPQSLCALGCEDRETQSRKEGPRSGRHHRLFPGWYAATAEEWTEKGRTFSCVATFGAVPVTTNTTERRGGAAGKNGRGSFLKIRELNSIVLPGGGAASLIVPDPERVRAARAMDEEEPWDPASKRIGGGFFYLTNGGEVLSVPSPKGFEERYVLLDDASFFEVSGPLAAAQGGAQGGSGDDVAASLRAAFRARAGVLRVLYAASTGPRTVDAMARQMRDTGVAARPRRTLDAQFPGQHLAVFYQEGDGPDRDITETVNLPDKGASHPTNHTALGKTYCVEGSAEFLRVEVCGDRDGGGGSGGGHRARAASVVSLWAIGRVSLRVEARSFDEALGEDRRAAAASAFMASWALTMQNLRGVCSERAFAARSRANAEAKLIARVSCGLRLCSLDRACGEEIADAVGTAALKQALAAGLRLPSRFPASATSLADRHSSAVYLQAAKVVRHVMITGAQQNARGREAGTGLGVTLLLHSLKQAAFHPVDDPIARHFLRPMLTPAFQEALTGGARQENRAAERTIQLDGLRAALDAAAAHPQQRATTEEAFTILVRFGQAPVHGTALEGFAKNAEELGSGNPPVFGDHNTTPTVRSRSANGAAAALSTTCLGASAGVVVAKGTGQADERCPSGLSGALEGATAPEPGGCGEASSVLLGASEIADLAAELDPMRRIDRAFATLAETFDGSDASSVAGAAAARGRRRQRHYHSPLHSYAVARRCRSWTDKLEEVGDILTTTQLRLGRRGQDLLLAGTADTTAPVPPGSRPPTAMPELELIAQAKAVMASTARRQLDEADSGSDARVVDGKGYDDAAILTAQIHRHAPLPDRSKKGVRAFEGRGFYGGRGAASRRGDAGEPVAVLEVSPAFGRREPTTTDGGHGRRTIGENLAFAASVLSVRVLRQQPGLIGVHPWAVVIEDTKSRRVDAVGERRREESADPADGYSPVPVRIVCERLEGWRSLRDVILEQGPLAMPSEIAAGEGGEGLRVLRFWGRQLASILECLSSASLLVRDLRMSTVFVSPDGSTVKIVDFSSIATFSLDTGLVSSEAPKLDCEIHGPTMPLTPPEALAIRGGTENGGVSDGSGGSIEDNRRDGVSLVLADTGRPGPFPITAAWDVWTLGILLFELAFGHPPPAYGESLRRGLSSLALDNPTSGGTKVTPVPKLDDLVTEIQYDFLSAVGGLTHKEEGNGVGLATAHVGDSPLEKALGGMSLGAAIGEGDPFHVESYAGVGGGTSATWDDGRKSVHRFRRAWVRRQLQIEEGGDLDVTTWQTFQEKLRDHLDVSVASAVAATTTWSPISGGDEGGGRKKVEAVHHDHGAPFSSKRMTRQAAEAAVNRTVGQLVGADPRGTGRLPFSVVRGVLRDELQLSFSTCEAELVAFCLRDTGVPEGNGGDAEGRDADSPAGQSYREGEGNVLYIPLVHVLRAASLSSAASAPGLSRSLRTGDDTLHPPTPASFVELLFACLEPNPNRRPSSAGLLGLPFLSPRRQRTSGEDDRKAATEYMAGSGNDLSPTMVLRERVESRIQALEAVSTLNHHSATRARPVRGRGGDGASTNVGIGVLVEALKELEGLLHRSSPPVDRLGEDDYPQQARRVTLGHSKLIGEIFETGVLVRAAALALRFLDREEAEAVGRGVSGVGFVEGDPKKTVGARVLLALARVLEGLLLDLRRPGSAVRPYADIVLRCLVTLFLGEEGFLAVRYGNISDTTVGKSDAATESAKNKHSSTGCSEGGKSHWQPTISQMFEGLLVDAVGETGEGGFSYPTIQRYIRRCALATHQPGVGALYGDSDDLEGLGDVSGDWTSSSSDDEDDGGDDDNADFGDTRGASTGGRSGLIRSHVPPMFVRASTYFAELLALGRVLYALHRGSRTSTGGFASATGRARRQATAYCLTVVRMCCDVGSGGLDKAEPLGWMGGGRELDEDGATLQRTQLLVDARLGEKLAPCLHDPDLDVRRDAVSCALSALQGGHKRLQWVSMSVRRLDPRALLSLGFCTTVWVSAFAAIIRGLGAPALGSANLSRSARESEEYLRRMALQCLGYMAEGGDLATHSWRGCRVLFALQGLLSRGGSPGVGESMPWGRISGGDGREGGRRPDSNGWKEEVVRVLQSLAQNGSGETHSMIRAQPGLTGALGDPQLVLSSESLLTPKGLASTATELLKGAGTQNEILALVHRVRSMLATAVRIGDQRVLGSTDRLGTMNTPEATSVTMSLVWGWMQRALLQLSRDESDHPSTAARASLAWECLGLMHFLLGAAAACKLARCEIHPDLAGEVSRASVGGDSGTSSSSDGKGNGRDTTTAGATFDLARAQTGLETLVLLLSMEVRTSLDLYRAHPIPSLAVGATDTLAEALAHGDRETVDAMENHGLGVRLGLAVEASTRLTRESRRLGVEEVHLLRTYPTGRLARVKLFDRILCHQGGRGGDGGRGLQAQLIVSGLVEFITSNMLPDCAVTDIVSTQLPAAFVRHNGTPLVRNEGIAFLERVVARRAGCPAVAREAARQAVRHGLPPAECTRLREIRHRSVRAGVSACLRCLARLESPPVDRALKLAGVPRRAVLRARRDHGAAETRRQWARWVRHKATTLGEAPPTPSTHAAPIEDRNFDNGELQALARHDVHSTTVTPQPNNTQAALGDSKTPEGRVGIDAPHRRENRPLSFVAEEADGAAGKSPIPNNTPTAPEKEKNVVLTIEGEFSTLSVPGVRELLAAELATPEESIRVIEVGGGSNGSSTGGGDTSRQAPPAARIALSSTSGGRSTLKLALPGVIATQLYTRCLAGVLRVPGLLFVEVEGKGKLAWNGEEIVPDEVAPRRLQSALSPAPATPPLSRQPPPPAYASPPRADSRTPSLRRPPINAVLDRPSSVGESRTPPVPDGFKNGRQGVQKTASAQGGGGMQGIQKFSWLGGQASGTTKGKSDDEEDNDSRVAHRLGARVNLDAAGEDSAPPRGPVALASRSAPLLSPHEQRARVAVALDRMGASVVEVRDAFQRWVPRGRAAARSSASSAQRAKSKKTVSFSDSETAAEGGPDDDRTTAICKEGMVHAMVDLRLPLETAEQACDGAGGDGATTGRAACTFSNFVCRYADASGLLKETTPSGKKSQGEIWAEGRGGMWTAIPLNEWRGARIIFDEQAKEHNQEDKSNDGVLSLEQSLDKEGAIATLERLRVENPDGVALKSYFDDRGGVIDELFGGRVSFQELVRAILILDPTVLTLHSPGHTSTLDDASGVGLPSQARTKVSGPGGYFDGMPGRVLGDSGGGGANRNDHQGHRARASSIEEEARSSPPPYPGYQSEDGTRVKAAPAVNDRDEERAGVAAAAARLRLERDEREERRAWAQRTIVGRTFRSTRPAAPPISLGAARPQHAGRETNRVSSSNRGAGDGKRGQGRSTRRRREHAQTTKDTAPADVTAASEKNETAGDVVSRAFERYASDRDRDRERGFGGGRAGQRPWQHPASTTSFALPGDGERQQRSPWTLGIDGDSGAESDGSAAEYDDYANASTLGYKRRQSRTDREAQQAGVPPSDIYRGAPLGNGTGQQAMGVNSGDEGGGRSRRSSFVWRRSMEREGAGEHGEGLGGGDGGERYGSGSGDERGYGDGDAAVGSPERERALRGAFDMYDLNGDGFITYLELKAVFQQRRVTASDEDLREWIKQRDTSGTGAVDFADFSKAFVFSS
ncbi:unnamed protein product, partial [Ectocarpus sp. 12 AP-2014]